MKTSMNFKLIGISLLLVAGLTACDKPGPGPGPGPAESTGKKLDQTAESAGKKISETTDKVGKKLDQQSIKAGIAINDAEITSKIKAAIFAEPGLKTLQISVDTINGVVTLSGSVDSQANSDTAKLLAGAVAGVKEVDNRLVLKAAK